MNVPPVVRLFEALQSPQLGEPEASTLESLIRAEASSCPDKDPLPDIRSVQRAALRVVPIGGQVEPSAQLKAVPTGVQPTPRHRPHPADVGTFLSVPGAMLIRRYIRIKGVLWALLLVPA